MNIDTFSLIVDHLNWRAISALSLIDKKTYQIHTRWLRTIKSQQYAQRPLYPRQIAAIYNIKQQLNRTEDNKFQEVVFEAFPSFGKTLVAIEVAYDMLKHNPKKTVFIIIASNYALTWLEHFTKFYEISFKSHIQNRTVLYVDKSSCASFMYLKNKGSTHGKIILITSKMATEFESLKDQICCSIFDEVHKNANINNQVRRLLMTDTTIHVFIGATVPIKSQQTISCNSATQYVLPKMNVHHELMRVSFQTFCERIIGQNPKKNIIVANENGNMTLHKIDERLIFNHFTSVSKTPLRNYDEKGGIFSTTTNIICEGLNFNNTDIMIVFNNNIKLHRLRQCVSRIHRTSSSRSEIDVYLYCPNENALARGLLVDISCSGYDIHDFAGCIVKHLGKDKIMSMAKIDRLTLLGTPNNENKHIMYGDSRESHMTILDIHALWEQSCNRV